MSKSNLEAARDVPLCDVSQVDWSRNCVSWGVKLPEGNEDWSTLDYEDLKILRKLLSQLIKTGPDEYMKPSETGGGLSAMYNMCDSMIKWYERKVMV